MQECYLRQLHTLNANVLNIHHHIHWLHVICLCELLSFWYELYYFSHAYTYQCNCTTDATK